MTIDIDVEQQKQRLDMLKGEASLGDPVAAFALDKLNEMMQMLVECRDVLPVITRNQARLHGLDLGLAERLEAVIAPWAVDKDEPGAF